VQDRLMNFRLGLGLASLGFVASLAGCGLRTDPDYTPVCVDDSNASDGDGDTAGTGSDDGMPGEPRSGSCQNPVDLPAGETIVVRGNLGGCSGTEGWCGGSGGEDVYRIGSVGNDVFIDFLPGETNFNPVLRVVREDPCGLGEVESSEVCADIKNSVPGRAFYDQGDPGDIYYIIVDTELGESGKYAFELRFGEGSSEGDCFDATEEQVIELAEDGSFVWEADLAAEQGRVDSGCSAPGSDHIFNIVTTGVGTVSASVEVLEGDIDPIVSIRTGCSTLSELSCGPTASANLGANGSALLVVDQVGAAKGRYRLTVDYL